jgi:sulfhydrogenase subunit beta (sulfur reductase)
MTPATEKPLWRLTGPQLLQWISDLLAAGERVIAPVEKNGRRIFAPLDAPEQMRLGEENPRQSPKEFVFPRCEALFRYQLRGSSVDLVDPVLPEQAQVLFGLHPCDAAGLARLDRVLGADPFYAWRRERSAVVALACTHLKPACFCTAVGGSPVGEEGADILLAASGEGWIARVSSAAGEALVEPACAGWDKAFAGDWEQVVRQGQGAAERAERPAIPDKSAQVLESRFDSEAWQKTARRCVGCSICTYVCPSCSCFDVADQGTSWAGTRHRTWDSCSFALFTLHASGHNPRPTPAARLRQRVLHKFAYYPQRYGGTAMCVGCGRCIEQCPVGIDIHHQVVHLLQTPQESSDGKS